MCIFSAPSPPKDNSAELARQREEERQARIDEGRGEIDEAFKPFDDTYFSGVEKTYSDYYTPQIDDQYADARKKLVLALSRTGNLNAGAGAQQLGSLKQKYDTQSTAYANQARDQANEYRGKIENEKSDLYAQNRSAADPAAIAVDAASRAGTLSTAPSASPIGALFSDVLSNIATGIAAERQGYRGLNTGLFSPKKGESVSYVT